MKKILLIIIACALSILIFSFIKIESIKKDNKILEEEINKITSEISKIETDNQKYESDINNEKNNKSEELEELEIWLNYKEKLTKALS